jgi:hypothetical protein
MKKIITLLCCLLYSYGFQLEASVLSIAVPEKLLGEQSSLMIFMQDPNGTQMVGRCHLNNETITKKITQNQLQLTTLQEASSFDTIADLTDSVQNACEFVLLEFEHDSSLQVFKILVVKDSFLAENPFDIWTFRHDFAEFGKDEDELAFLSEIAEGVDVQALEQQSMQDQQKVSMFKQYMVYAQIFMLMQYGKVKRNVHAWLGYE